MRKVCVISAYAYIKKHINYGSLFQYYALERYLERLECKSYWARFLINEEEKKGLKKYIKKIFYYKRNSEIKRVLDSFHEFCMSNLRLSKNEYYGCIGDISDLQADAYITGSDQVWAGTLPENYLTFVPDDGVKISYAASFGRAELQPDHLNTVAPWLKRFNNISVREPSGVKICNDVGVKAVCLIDPTLLLESSMYPISDSKSKKYTSYIFGYFLNISKKQLGVYDEFLRKANQDFKSVVWTKGVSDIDYCKELKCGDYFSPAEWIGMYKNADGILTNTFHGTVFAIIFKKPFLVHLQSGKTGQQNERILSLLSMLGLEERIYNSLEDAKKQMQRDINWEYVQKVIEDERNKAKIFLSEALM